MRALRFPSTLKYYNSKTYCSLVMKLYMSLKGGGGGGMYQPTYLGSFDSEFAVE